MDFVSNNFTNNAFRWFTGVVEDVRDPEEKGRVKVRCYGYHSDSRADIPTEDLPFAHVMMPITSASVSGIGQSATGVLPGSWVVGFFRDGEACQDPLILGTIPSSTPATKNPVETGFCDKSGANPREPGEVDNPKGSRSDYTDSHSFRTKVEMYEKTKETISVGPFDLGQGPIQEARIPRMKVLRDNKDDAYFVNQEWMTTHPLVNTRPQYPDCHTTEYKSGHTVEYDDTLGKERILDLHKSGTYQEVDAKGNKTTIVNGDDYQVIFKDHKVSVKGSCSLTVDGDCRTKIRGNHHLEVEGDYSMYVHGSVYKKIGLSEFSEISSDVQENINGKVTKRVGKSQRLLINEDYNVEVVNDQNISVGVNRVTAVHGDDRLVVIGNYTHGVNGVLIQTSTGNMVLDTTAEMKLDAPNFSLDFTNGNITTTSGTITSQTRSLHSHTHDYSDSTGSDAAAGTTDAPNAST